MNKINDGIQGEGDKGNGQEQSSTNIIINDSIAMVTEWKSEQKPMEINKDSNNEKEREKTSLTKEETMNTLRLLGDPLATHGPYTFYSELAYRKHGDVTKHKRRRWKRQQSQTTKDGDKNATVFESYDSSSSCCCDGDNTDNGLCSCDDDSSLCSSSLSNSEWSVVRMNHFYAVRPWYSKRNSSINDQQQQQQPHQKCSSKSTKSTDATAERRQHHYQQSVCIGELELLWRDDSVVTGTVPFSSLLKKRSSNRGVPPPLMESNGDGDRIDMASSNNSHVSAIASSDDEESFGGRNEDDLSAVLPRRRTLPRRTRQPSAKKLEATESYAAAAGSMASEHNPLTQYRRNRLSSSALSDPTSTNDPIASSNVQYRHGNVLCSVRLYVMPDQTAAGRLSGIHGEDEVLEINTWGTSGGVDRWPSNISINGSSGLRSIYNNSGGVDDFGYGSGSHSSGTLPSGCSGLVLRAEDFIEWVRGGLMNDEDIEFDELIESECVVNSLNNEKPIKTEQSEQNDEQQLKLSSPMNTNNESENKPLQKEKLETLHNVKNTEVKLKSTIIADEVKKEQLALNSVKLIKEEKSLTTTEELNEVKTEGKEITSNVNLHIDRDKELKQKQNDSDKNLYLKSVIDQAVEAERVPLAAAKIHKEPTELSIDHLHHCPQHNQLHCESSINGNNSDSTCTVVTKHGSYNYEERIIAVNKVDNKDKIVTKSYCPNCKRRRHHNFCKNKQIKTSSFGSNNNINKQRLVVMSYSRYCRYRAQLQRKHEEKFNKVDSTVVIDKDGKKIISTACQGMDSINTTRVLFCRDTYDYPAELLLEPFNVQNNQQQNTTVLVNHMAPKLKGWPSYPASWMSFRWNRVRRRLRHLERGSGSNDDRRRRRRRQKLKKKCRQRHNGTSGTAVAMSYLSSTEDDDSDDSDSDEGSSVTNDANTNTTTTTSTSDSDGTPPFIVKTANKNNSGVIAKVNGGVHNNKKSLSTTSANNIILINGATTTVSTGATNKRSAIIGQSCQQQATKRRRVIYTSSYQPQLQNQQQRVAYKQQQQQHPRPKLPHQQQSNNRPRQLEQFNQLISPSQRHQQKFVQQQQQQQQRLHLFNRRFPTPISSIQSSTTRVIHHHLPPSVTIMPVIVPTTNTATFQQQQKQNNRPQNRQEQHTTEITSLTVSPRRNNNSDRPQIQFPPVIIEYDDDENQEYGSDDNGRYKKSTVAAAMAACHRRVGQQDLEDEQRQQREEEERQRRWLVDALRLGGLEVTAVPLNVNTSSGNSGDSKNSNVVTPTLQQQRQLQWRQRGVSFESLMSTENQHYNGDIVRTERGDDDSNLDSDTDSVVMTVTPDVVCILKESPKHEQLTQRSLQEHILPESSSTITSLTRHQQQRRQSININSDSSSSSSQQHQPVATTAAAAAALHDKINRAIDSLKQQQQNSNTIASTSNSNKNVLMMVGNNQQHTYIENNSKKQQKRCKPSNLAEIQQQQQTSTLLDLTVKPLVVTTNTVNTIRQQKHSIFSTVNSNQHKIILPPFYSTASARSSTAEITIVPVTASSTTNTTRLLSQQQNRSNLLSVPQNDSIGISDILSVPCSASSISARQHLQRRNTAVSSTANITPASIIDVTCSSSRRQHQQRSGSGVSITIPSLHQQPKLIMTTSAIATTSTQQQKHNDKRKPQQNKKS